MSGGRQKVLAGVDIGGTAIQALLCTPEFTVLSHRVVPTPDGGANMIVAAIGMIRELVAELDAELIGVGIGAAGVIDARTGTVLAASDTFSGWAGYPVAARMSESLGVPVRLENDVNAFLIGEIAVGAIRGERDALAIMLGTGVGGALWSEGRLFSGPHGAAGEIGHMPGFGDLLCTCGRHGHLETLASGRQIEKRHRELTGTTLTARQISARASAGDPDACAVFAQAGTAVGKAIAAVAALVDITTVVVGGGVSQSWQLLEPAITGYLAAEPPVSGQAITLRHSSLGKDAVAVGAASRAWTEFNG